MRCVWFFFRATYNPASRQVCQQWLLPLPERKIKDLNLTSPPVLLAPASVACIRVLPVGLVN
jgi:hypothetical protein